MSEITITTFERCVAKYFEPIAREHGWPLIRLRQKVYEISSSHFVMRVRYDEGAHTKTINATLLPLDKMPGDIEKGGKGELGVRVVAGYHGVDIGFIPREQTEEGFFAEARYVADLSRRFAVPYLEGKKADWKEVENHLEKLIGASAENIKSYKFPPFVQKRWHLPPPETTGEKG